jgi:hypothetical protein
MRSWLSVPRNTIVLICGVLLAPAAAGHGSGAPLRAFVGASVATPIAAPPGARPLAACALRLTAADGRLSARATLAFAPGAGPRCLWLGSRFRVDGAAAGQAALGWRTVDPAEAAALLGETGLANSADFSWRFGAVQVLVFDAAPAAADTVELAYSGPLPEAGAWAVRLLPEDLFCPFTPGTLTAYRLELPGVDPARCAGTARAEPDGNGGAVLVPARPVASLCLLERVEGAIPWRRCAHWDLACLDAGGDPAAEPVWNEAAAGLAAAESLWGGYPWPSLVALCNGAPDGRPRSYPGVIDGLAPFGPAAAAGDSISWRAALRHELLHGWFGVGVPTAPGHGDWSEGLCALLADNDVRAASDPRAAARFRHGLLLRLEQVAGSPADVPLGQYRQDVGDAAPVGYGKGLFFFLELRRRLGAAPFQAALRRFAGQRMGRPSTWSDLLEACQAESRGTDLRPLFAAWLEARGLPELRIESAQWRALAREARLVLAIAPASGAGGSAGEGPPPGRSLPLLVPVRFDGLSGEPAVARLDRAEQAFLFPLPYQPASVTIDPDYEVLRAPGRGPLTVPLSPAPR